MSTETAKTPYVQKCTLFCVYFALLLDNLLLTAVVPILPHFVHGDEYPADDQLKQQQNGKSLDNITADSSPNHLLKLLKTSVEHYQRSYQSEHGENSRLGFLLSLKAIVQLVANPLVVMIIRHRGFSGSIIFGTINLILSSLLFAFGETYEILATARALQGMSSACFTVAGLGLVATTHKDEMSRSVALGQALGGGAMGVLLGYPTGGILYQLGGKTAPFLFITTLEIILLVVVVVTLHFSDTSQSEESEAPPVEEADLLITYRRPRVVLVISIGSIFLTTSVMALLEPCIPLWMLKTMSPVKRWQLGAVFLPDSLGYILTTHFMGGVAYRFGRWKVAMISMIVLGISCTMVPLATAIFHLTLPHFGIGAGIGAIDAALVPQLATLAEGYHQKNSKTTYGGTFALGQTAVSLAYCLGPLLGGVLVEAVGFPRLMVAVGVINLLYTPLLILLNPDNSNGVSTSSETTALKAIPIRSLFTRYTRFQNE